MIDRSEHGARWLFEGAFLLSAIFSAYYLTSDFGISGLWQSIVIASVAGIVLLVFVTKYRQVHSCLWFVAFMVLAVYLLWHIGFLIPLIEIAMSELLP